MCVLIVNRVSTASNKEEDGKDVNVAESFGPRSLIIEILWIDLAHLIYLRHVSGQIRNARGEIQGAELSFSSELRRPVLSIFDPLPGFGKAVVNQSNLPRHGENQILS